MDRRIIFFMVFVITFASTLLVAGVAIWTKQPLIDTALYAVATMWIMGIVSQLLLQNLYQAIVKPLDQARVESKKRSQQVEVNLDDIEEIDQATQRVNQMAADRKSRVAPLATPEDLAKVGSHVEQKG